MLAADSDKLLGLFAPIGLPHAWDRDETIPSLAEMSSAAIETLSRNPKGFFLMIEGSQIDWAAHSNDISGVISEMEDFVAAIEVALEFARTQGNTLVVITADHETGGLSMGRDDIYAWNPRPLRGMKKTAQGIVEEFMLGEEPLSAVVQRNVGFELTEQEVTDLDTAKPEIPPYPDSGMTGTHAHALLSLLLEKRTLTGWSTVGHTGVDVPLYAYGPGSEAFRGTLENEELGKRLQQALLEP